MHCNVLKFTTNATFLAQQHPDFLKFWSIHFNFLVPERYAFLSGTCKMKMAKPKVEGTPVFVVVVSLLIQLNPRAQNVSRP